MLEIDSYDNHALFIGVDDYSAYDASTGAPEGTSNLPGSCNDAVVFWRLQRQLGVPARNLRILTSPKVDVSLLEGATQENVGEATEQGILDAAIWLAEALSAPSRPSGLLTFSGHGGYLERQGLALCPSDVTGKSLEHAIAYQTLHRIFVKRGATQNLTVLLDCCHSAARAPRGRRVHAGLSSLPLPSGLAERTPLIGSRVLAACDPAMSSFQARIGGAYRGAFSWAVSSVMDQWVGRPCEGGVELTLSYGDLLERANRLLATLSFDQAPVLRGRPGVASLPVFHTGGRKTAQETSADPNAERHGGQLDPNVKYALNLATLTHPNPNLETNQVLSTDAYIDPEYKEKYGPVTEYWSLTSDFLQAVNAPADGTSLIVSESQDPIDWSSLAFPASGTLAPFGMPNNTVWTKMLASQPPPAGAFYTSATSSHYVGVRFDLSAPSTGAPWGGSITWYLGLSSTEGFVTDTYAVSSGLTLSKGSAPALPSATTWSWYFARLTPLTWPTQRNSSSPVSTVNAAAATFSSTSSASLKDRMWLAYVSVPTGNSGPGSTCDVLVSSSTGGSWTSATTVVTNVNWLKSPSITILGGDLYVGYVGSGASTLALRSSSNGSSWSQEIATPVVPATRPALAARGSTLYVAYCDSSALRVRSNSDPSNSSGWSNPALVTAIYSASSPAMIAFNNKLYIAYSEPNTYALKIYSSSDGSTWALATTLWGGLTNPSMTVFNGFLYVAARTSIGDDAWILSSPDGVSWSGYGCVSDQIKAVVRSNAVLSAASSTALVFCWQDPSNNFYNITGT